MRTVVARLNAFLWLLPKRVVIMAIRFYQWTVSPDHGPLRKLYPYGVCKYHPTCSEYAVLAVERFGITRGLWLSWKRLMRCNPWSKGGIDEVPISK
jgi:putative membrane protein insertion efficiency factor